MQETDEIAQTCTGPQMGQQRRWWAKVPTEASDEVPTELLHEVSMDPSDVVPTEPSGETETRVGVVAAAIALSPYLTSDTEASNAPSLYRMHIHPDGVRTWAYYQRENGSGQQGRQALRVMDSLCKS